MSPAEQIRQQLRRLGISFKQINHRPVLTVDEAVEIKTHLKSEISKTLFLTNKKHTNFYLVVMIGSKKLDLKKLAKIVNETKLTFASAAELEEQLETYQGAVSPFGAIFIKNPHKCLIILDEDLDTGDYLGFHPNENFQTIELTNKDFAKFIDSLDIKKLKTNI